MRHYSFQFATEIGVPFGIAFESKHFQLAIKSRKQNGKSVDHLSPSTKAFV
jgi:hypothetical protein